MQRIFLIVAIAIFAISVLLIHNGVSDDNPRECVISGVAQRCHPENGCPKVPVPYAEIRLEVDTTNDGTFDYTDTETCNLNGYYCFVTAGDSLEARARIKASKTDGTWSSGWRSFTTPGEDESIEINLISDDFLCNCL